MKSTLLTTTALIAFAGAAAAEVTFSGSAGLGYNDTTAGDEDGFYWDANVAVTLSQELDNGLTAGASFDFDAADHNNGQDLVSGGYVLSLTSDTAGLYFGDTAFAAETRWVSAGDMEQDAFSEADGETVLRGDVAFGAVEASISYVIADVNGASAPDDTEQLSVGVAADLGQFTVVGAYQEFGEDGPTGNGDYNVNEIFGISVGATMGAADITVAYASDETAGESSTGVKVAYTVSDAITATAYYVDESNGDANYGVNVAYSEGAISGSVDYQDDQGVSKWAVNAAYDMGNNIALFGGVENQNEGADVDYHLGGTYDLGSGASLLVVYAEDADFDQGDEIGSGDYQEGTTVEVNFTF